MSGLSELRDQWVSSTVGLMAARGWETEPAAWFELDNDMLGALCRRFAGGFVGRVEFPVESSFQGRTRGGKLYRPPWFSAAVEIGLSYEPADRLLRALRGDMSTMCMIDLRGRLASNSAVTKKLSGLDEVECAAKHLVEEVVDSYAADFLSERSSVDEFLSMCREFSVEWERFVVPAVLGACGRRGDALEWLDGPTAQRARDGEPEGYDDYAARLRAWLKSGVPVPREADLPPEPELDLPNPPPDHFQPVEALSVVDEFSEIARRRLERQAVEHVRSHRDGASRDAQRAMLLSELASGSIERDPIWIERTLDQMMLSDEENRRRVRPGRIESALAIGEFLKSALTGAGDGDDYEVPEWMRPPSVTLPGLIEKESGQIAVELDPDVDWWLTKVFETRPIASVPVLWHADVWLAWSPPTPSATSVLTVHMGPHRVGTVPAVLAENYRPMITAVQAVRAWPEIDGALARLDSGAYVLQIPLPQRR